MTNPSTLAKPMTTDFNWNGRKERNKNYSHVGNGGSGPLYTLDEIRMGPVLRHQVRRGARSLLVCLLNFRHDEQETKVWLESDRNLK